MPLKVIKVVLGALILIVSLGFVGREAWRHADTIASFSWGLFSADIVGLGFLVYAFAGVLGFLCWYCLLVAGGGSIPVARAGGIALTAQIGKYIPGNIAHHLGKTALVMREGVTLKTAASSTLAELMVTIVAAALIVLTALAVEGDFVGSMVWQGTVPAIADFWSSPWLVGLVVVGCIGLIVGVLLACRRTGLPLEWRGLGLVLLSLTLQIANFLIVGLTFFLVLSGIAGEAAPPWQVCIGMFCVAWLGGFLTPGSPGGLGVREALLLALVGVSTGAGDALLAGGIHRAFTLAGDVLLFVIGSTAFRFSASTAAGTKA